MKLSKTLNKKLYQMLEEDTSILLLGEDIVEPYGGAFKITKGLSEKFPDRVISTPMSEQGFLGMSVGMALRGLKPIVEIMYGDFLTLCADQLINHASKFVDIYGRDVPMVVRLPVGGYRGYGATHSQSIEKLFFGIPNIDVVALSILDSGASSLQKSVNKGNPTLYIENKIDYTRDEFDESKWNKKFIKQSDLTEGEFCTYNLSLVDQNTDSLDTLIVTYGGMVSLALEASWKVFIEEEIAAEIIVPELISPLEDRFISYLGSKLQVAKRLVVLEEGWGEFGWGSGLVSHLAESGFLKGKIVKRVASYCQNIGAGLEYENSVLPTLSRLENAMYIR